MPIVPQFTTFQIKEYMLKNIERYEATILDAFKRTGEKAVAYMRSLNTFKDQTANLRNSEGYIIYKDGELAFESYPNDASGPKEGPKVGASIGKGLAIEVAQQFAPRKGFIIVVTAGMEYALYVEAKGYDVITGGAREAARFIKDRMFKIHKKISRAA
ncbi:hypothetical protein [Niabella aurantiaca]|uniref:hypothetical protein n=1 Tax=Niabella aurantiaca TaxID=379900 RepID=UPI0003761E82|nr:hypothetical protein [Niabella aurantiaca]